MRVRPVRSALAEPWLRQEQKVVRRPPENDQRRNHPCLRGQIERLARLARPHASTSFETIACRNVSASGPRTAT